MTNDDEVIDKDKLTAPIKSTADKFQLVPEFLKVRKNTNLITFALYKNSGKYVIGFVTFRVFGMVCVQS